MLRFTFRGGIHPDDGKAMSKDKPIREVLPKGELVVWDARSHGGFSHC